MANYHLAGIVDSREAFAMMALVWCLRSRRWAWLPLLGVLGVLAKETFVVWLALLGLAGMATLVVLFSVGNGHLVLPWELERSGAIDDGMWQRAWQLTSDRGTLYIFGWLFPLGVFGLRRCPREWLAGAGAASAAVVTLGLYNGEPGVARSLFNVAGPLLGLGSAVTLSRLLAGLRPSGAWPRMDG